MDPGWLPVRPFWTDLDPKYRVGIIDLPYLAALPDRPNMTVINGWQCHDDFGRLELPEGLWPAELIPTAFEWLGAPPPERMDWGADSGEHPPRGSRR